MQDEYSMKSHRVIYSRLLVTQQLDQEWIDSEDGINWIFNAANKFPEDTRIVRLRALENGV